MSAPILFHLQRVRLNQGGYDSMGVYWGGSEPLYWYCNDAHQIDDTIRAFDREDAKFQIRKLYPTARFYR